MTDRLSYIRAYCHWRIARKCALTMLRATGYDTPAGREIATARANDGMAAARRGLQALYRTPASERTDHALVAWRTGRGMDGYDNIAAAE